MKKLFLTFVALSTLTINCAYANFIGGSIIVDKQTLEERGGILTTSGLDTKDLGNNTVCLTFPSWNTSMTQENPPFYFNISFDGISAEVTAMGSSNGSDISYTVTDFGDGKIHIENQYGTSLTWSHLKSSCDDKNIDIVTIYKDN